jgi:hypothetical protein
MLINMPCVPEAPSRGASAAGSRRLADLGPGALVRTRGRGDLAAEAGYLPGLAGSFRPAQVAASPVQTGILQVSVVTKSTVQNSNDKHNTIQVTRLVPATQGEVGPHPVREPGPA